MLSFILIVVDLLTKKTHKDKFTEVGLRFHQLYWQQALNHIRANSIDQHASDRLYTALPCDLKNLLLGFQTIRFNYMPQGSIVDHEGWIICSSYR